MLPAEQPFHHIYTLRCHSRMPCPHLLFKYLLISLHLSLCWHKQLLDSPTPSPSPTRLSPSLAPCSPPQAGAPSLVTKPAPGFVHTRALNLVLKLCPKAGGWESCLRSRGQHLNCLQGFWRNQIRLWRHTPSDNTTIRGAAGPGRHTQEFTPSSSRLNKTPWPQPL